MLEVIFEILNNVETFISHGCLHGMCIFLSICSELEEEMVFEEFKRTYLKGMIEDEDEGNVSTGEH